MSAEASQTSIPTVQDGAALPNNYSLFTVGARYEAAPSTVADGQARGFQIDSAGKLAVNAAQSGNWTVRIQDSSGGSITVGQKTMAASLPVVVASDQTAIPIKLNDGAGTSVTVGQKVMASSLPVVISSDQSNINVAQAGTWNMRLQDGSGSAVNKGQTTMSGSLPVAIASDQTAIKVNLQDGSGSAVSKGQAAMAASLPVTIASDQNMSTGYVRSNTGNLTGTAQTVTINPSGAKTIVCQLSGAFSGVVTFEASEDNGTTWSLLSAWDQGNVGFSTTANVSGRQYVMPAYGNLVRARCSTFVSGTIVVTFIAGLGDMPAVYVSPVTFFPVQGNVAQGSSISGTNPLLVGGTFTTSPAVLSTGQQGSLQQDANQNLLVSISQIVPLSGSTNALTSVASAALEASHVLKASAGRLYQLTGVNTKASGQYIQVFNSTTVPADTTVPVLLAYVPSLGVFSWDFGQIGRYFSTGIAVSNSSTAATKTIGAADCWFNAEVA